MATDFERSHSRSKLSWGDRHRVKGRDLTEEECLSETETVMITEIETVIGQEPRSHRKGMHCWDWDSDGNRDRDTGPDRTEEVCSAETETVIITGRYLTAEACVTIISVCICVWVRERFLSRSLFLALIFIFPFFFFPGSARRQHFGLDRRMGEFRKIRITSLTFSCHLIAHMHTHTHTHTLTHSLTHSLTHLCSYLFCFVFLFVCLFVFIFIFFFCFFFVSSDWIMLSAAFSSCKRSSWSKTTLWTARSLVVASLAGTKWWENLKDLFVSFVAK